MPPPSPALVDLINLLQLTGTSGHEKEVATFIRGRLLQFGVPEICIHTDEAHKVSPLPGGKTGNLIVRIEGKESCERIMLSAHMDTVPLAAGAQPRLDGPRIVNDSPGKALGGDNRTGCAVLLHIARALCAAGGNHKPVTLVFFAQEEVGLLGSLALDPRLLGTPRPACCYNFDSGNIAELITSVTGTARFQITIKGIATHAGLQPEAGVSAALIAAKALAELAQNGWHGRITKPEGCGSANLGLIQGGTGSNTVMGELNLLAEARSHEAAFRRHIIHVWTDCFTRMADREHNAHGGHGSVTVTAVSGYESCDVPKTAPLVQAALRAARSVGVQAHCVINDGGTDANRICALGIPAITLACGQRNVHGPDEFIDVTEFLVACDLVRTLIFDTMD